LVGNHSGGVLTPDTSALIASWYRSQGQGRALYGLALDATFAIPGFGSLMRRIGMLPADPQIARSVLERGEALLVYPGGDHEVFRPYSDRNRVDLAGRTGFVKLALEAGVPVFPVVSHGGHHTTVVLTRGERIAKALGMARMRVKVYPLLLQLPWGVSTAAFPGLPLPAKITTRVCEPIDWSHHGPEAARDPEIVAACYQQISGVMQDAMDELAAEHPRPILSRLRSLFGRKRTPGLDAPQDSTDEPPSHRADSSRYRATRGASRARRPAPAANRANEPRVVREALGGAQAA